MKTRLQSGSKNRQLLKDHHLPVVDFLIENGRYARPTSDRNFAGAIAEK